MKQLEQLKKTKEEEIKLWRDKSNKTDQGSSIV
jgi:hypothetical protein